LGRNAVSAELRSFANTFAAMQEARHLADYDPTIRFYPSEVASLIAAAATALAGFDLVPADELTDVLALLMVKTRA
jgi:hypothetical protein